MSLKNRIIKKLGGYTCEEYENLESEQKDFKNFKIVPVGMNYVFKDVLETDMRIIKKDVAIKFTEFLVDNNYIKFIIKDYPFDVGMSKSLGVKMYIAEKKEK